jgi:DNA-binding NarL/FixJ family response regulator
MSKIKVFLGFSSVNKIMSLKTVFMQDSDIEIVGEANDAVDVLLNVSSTRAEVVVIDLPSSGKDSGLSSHLLAEYPELKVLAISEGGDKIVMYETAMLRREISNTSLGNLADLIRRSLRSLYNGQDAMRPLPK